MPNLAENQFLTDVIGRLRTAVEQSADPVLPSMKLLAVTFGVSEFAITQAARTLRDQGVVVFGRGRKIHIPGRTGQAPPERVASANALADNLAREIESGAIRAGEALPKVAALASRFHVSNTTVLAACRALQERELVHKTGKQWMVGPAPHRSSRINVRSLPPVILVVEDREHEWLWLAQLARTSRFCSQFSGEAERFGVVTMAAFTGGSQVPVGARCVGMEQTMAYAKALGQRHLGTLMLSSHRELPDLEAWIGALPGTGKPVVWFDRYDEDLRNRPSSLLLTRCHFSESAGVSLAVNLLARIGHRAAVYPITHPGFMDWQIRRAELLAAAAEGTGLEVRTVEKLIPESAASAIAAAPGRPWGTDESAMAAYEPLYRDLMERRDWTALIAPNDYSAYFFYHGLLRMGLGIPDHLSLISFDNDTAAQLLPITTVDFGLGHLGYCAFHALFRALPVQRDKRGDISAIPVVVDRGSVSRPRQGPIRAPFRVR